MIFLKETSKLLLAFLIIWLLYKDSKRIVKAFFLHLERKLLVIHLLKLSIFLLIVYKFKIYIPFYKSIIIVVCILLLLFLAILTLKQVKLSVKNVVNSKYKTFKYGSKFIEYILYLLVVMMMI